MTPHMENFTSRRQASFQFLLRSSSLQKMQLITTRTNRRTTIGHRLCGSPPPMLDVHVRNATIFWAADQALQHTTCVYTIQRETLLVKLLKTSKYRSCDTPRYPATDIPAILFRGLEPTRWCFPDRRHLAPLRLFTSQGLRIYAR